MFLYVFVYSPLINRCTNLSELLAMVMIHFMFCVARCSDHLVPTGKFTKHHLVFIINVFTFEKEGQALFRKELLHVTHILMLEFFLPIFFSKLPFCGFFLVKHTLKISTNPLSYGCIEHILRLKAHQSCLCLNYDTFS